MVALLPPAGHGNGLQPAKNNNVVHHHLFQAMACFQPATATPFSCQSPLESHRRGSGARHVMMSMQNQTPTRSLPVLSAAIPSRRLQNSGTTVRKMPWRGWWQGKFMLNHAAAACRVEQ